MPHDPECIFCKIVQGAIPAGIVYRNEQLLAFLDIGPLADGHLLVIPCDHYRNVTDLPEKTAAAIGSLIPRLAQGVLNVTGADGINVLANQGSAAGQVVPHVHFHLIPRKEGDGLGYRWNAGKYPPGRDAELVQAFKNELDH